MDEDSAKSFWAKELACTLSRSNHGSTLRKTIETGNFWPTLFVLPYHG